MSFNIPQNTVRVPLSFSQVRGKHELFRPMQATSMKEETTVHVYPPKVAVGTCLLLRGNGSSVGVRGRATLALASGSTPGVEAEVRWFPEFLSAQCPTAQAPALLWKGSEQVNSRNDTAVWKRPRKMTPQALRRAHRFTQLTSPATYFSRRPSGAQQGLFSLVGVSLP